MKIPKVKISYYYKDNTPVYVRYGIGRDGYYFFEVITKMRHGASFLFSTNFDYKFKWKRYLKYLNKLDVETRVKKVKKVLHKIYQEIDINDIPYGGTYKFNVKTLFKKIT